MTHGKRKTILIEATDPDIIEIAGTKIPRDTRKEVYIDVGSLYDFTEMAICVIVIRAKKPGPVLLISGGIHGDEILGPEIIKRLLWHKRLNITHGTLICVPIVNIFGYNAQSRYFPDRRDLNRCFPGSKNGSLAARVAHMFVHECLNKAHFAIDLHSAAVHRTNLPHIRAKLSDPNTKILADSFAAPVVLDTALRDHSLRAYAAAHDIPLLLFEGGEALRFDEQVIKVALRGILSVLETLQMLDIHDPRDHGFRESFIAQSSYWVRASLSGSMQSLKKLGTQVDVGTKLAVISDTLGHRPVYVTAKTSGIIIGERLLPLVNKGDALFHIATMEESSAVKSLSAQHNDPTDDLF